MPTKKLNQSQEKVGPHYLFVADPSFISLSWIQESWLLLEIDAEKLNFGCCVGDGRQQSYDKHRVAHHQGMDVVWSTQDVVHLVATRGFSGRCSAILLTMDHGDGIAGEERWVDQCWSSGAVVFDKSPPWKYPLTDLVSVHGNQAMVECLDRCYLILLIRRKTFDTSDHSIHHSLEHTLWVGWMWWNVQVQV